MDKKLRWGLIGTGAIARKFARGLAESLTGELVAVGSRAEESLQRFLKDFSARGHASYDALLADQEVEAVYISTPHPMHAHWAIKAARAGKHILCEKPFTMNAAEASAVLNEARAAGVFLMEAFMYRCHPQTARVIELVKQGRIGRVRLVQATFSFRAPWDPSSRLLDAALGGGAILDVGCYCASMSRLIAGVAVGAAFADPIEVKGVGQIGETGVDELAVAVMTFPCGMLAQLCAGLRVNLDNTVRIWGEEGHIVVPSPWVVNRDGPESRLYLHRDHEPVEEVTIRSERSIYAYEADAVSASLALREAPAMSWADTLGNMQTLDRWRKEIGLKYAADDCSVIE